MQKQNEFQKRAEEAKEIANQFKKAKILSEKELEQDQNQEEMARLQEQREKVL
jgi:hypothetical protein